MSAPSSAPTPRIVNCPACGARLVVQAADLGRRGQCRECGQKFRIGGATATGATAPAAAHSDSTASGPTLHPVYCRLCQTLMYATDRQVGTKLKCPDCGTLNEAKRREPKKPPPRVLVPDGEEYQLDEASSSPSTPIIVPLEVREAQFRAAARLCVGMAEEAAASASGSAASPRRSDGDAPRRPLIPTVQGVWRMMFTSEIGIRWMALSLVLTLILALVGGAANAMGTQALYLLPVYAVGCALAGAWLLSAAPLWIAVATQSSDGADELADPPLWLSFDFAESILVVVAGSMSALPAWLATKLAPDWSWQAQFALSGGVWLICFPFALLSALEQGSPLAVFSPRVAASWIRCLGPWLLFYVESLLLAAAVVYLTVQMSDSPRWFARLPLPWLAVGASLLYMRLIGRLGWWLADRTPRDD